jgi:hypothetical protein
MAGAEGGKTDEEPLTYVRYARISLADLVN